MHALNSLRRGIQRSSRSKARREAGMPWYAQHLSASLVLLWRRQAEQSQSVVVIVSAHWRSSSSALRYRRANALDVSALQLCVPNSNTVATAARATQSRRARMVSNNWFLKKATSRKRKKGGGDESDKHKPRKAAHPETALGNNKTNTRMKRQIR